MPRTSLPVCHEHRCLYATNIVACMPRTSLPVCHEHRCLYATNIVACMPRTSLQKNYRNTFSPAKTFRTVFWSVFGRGGSEVVTLAEYEHYLTENFGYLLYGLYNVIMVTVLINMLIAMMARSYQAIAVSWILHTYPLYI